MLVLRPCTVVLVPTLHPSCALQARNQSFETRCKLRQNGGANQGFHPHALRIHASARIHCALMHVYRITDSCSARSLHICIPWIHPTFEKFTVLFLLDLELPYSRNRTALRAPWPCMDYYRTAPVPVLQLCSTMAIVPVAPSVPNQVQDRLSAVGLVMQAKTLALKSCSANQRWCKLRTKTTVVGCTTAPAL